MLAILFALNCEPPTLVNVSKYPWVKYDYEILEQAKKRCGELYSDAKCVKLFRKFGYQSYTVICGEENKE